ncbi:MAG: WD40 repeat domain-containing protein [Planctomycetota bacterium]
MIFGGVSAAQHGALNTDRQATSEAEPFPWMARIADEAPVCLVHERFGDLALCGAETGANLKSIEEDTLGSAVWQVDLDPSGDLVALLTEDLQVWLWRWRSESSPQPVAKLEAKGEVWHGWRFGAVVEFSPSGDRVLAALPRGEVLLLNRAGERVPLGVRATSETSATGDGSDGHGTLRGAFALPHAWSSDGKRLALVRQSSACVFGALDGRVMTRFPDNPSAPMESVALDADGSRLAIGRYGGVIQGYDVESASEIWSYTFAETLMGGHDPQWNPIGFGDLEFSPNGALLAATSTTSIHGILLDAASGEALWSGAHQGGRMGEPAAIRWQPGSTGFYFAFVSGVMPIVRVAIEEQEEGMIVKERTLERGTLPDIGCGGTGIYVTGTTARSIEAASHSALWRR